MAGLEGIDLFADVDWLLIVDNICVSSGFPQINMGDGGPNPVFRLGFPDIGNNSFTGEYPTVDLLHSNCGPRDLYVDRDNTAYGTTIIEGNWNP